MVTEEEDIELTEDEISATRLALMVLCGLLEDLDDGDVAGEEDFERWQDMVKEQVGLEIDCNLPELLLSALRKFREEDTEHEEQNEASQD
ncbi:hypothetical protein LCGC14_2969320 [marine sediment metagenome]|uniref:Uncharacterized protein n=1 Tax=marine sediment metagenome TaxID=412755 RepID=A0A0F8X9X8_9ZZZZ